MDPVERIDEIVRIFNLDIDWEAKYDRIFDIVKELREAGHLAYLNYYDPDTSYEEDVTAVVNALIDYKRRYFS